jgi:hypothetical protein
MRLLRPDEDAGPARSARQRPHAAASRGSVAVGASPVKGPHPRAALPQENV